jgi:hypothetical protein
MISVCASCINNLISWKNPDQTDCIAPAIYRAFTAKNPVPFTETTPTTGDQHTQREHQPAT